MAYCSQETKKEVSPAIKAVMKKYGMKGSIAIRNHMVLVVNIKSGKLDIMENWYKKSTRFSDTNEYGDIIKKPEYISVNEYWIDSNYTGIVKDFLKDLIFAMKTPDWRNNSDIQSDYFDISYYTDVNIGSWNKPYQLEV